MNAIDLRPTIVAKSDQLNADDLIGTTRTIKITAVRLRDAADQPIAIHYEGDDGKPYLPCKSMRRVMVAVWGDDGSAFVGQRLTLFRDDKVRFGADAVGGIRISHISGIDREKTIAIMVTRGQRKPYTVKPLVGGSATRTQAVDVASVLADGREEASRGSAALRAWWAALSPTQQAAAKATLESDLKPAAVAADKATTDDGFGDMPAHDADTGEIIEHDLPGHADEAEDDGFPGDRRPPADDFDVEGWARALIDDDGALLNKAADVDALFHDTEACARFTRLQAESPTIARELEAALKGRKKALADRERAR
jgi:hypothetical protein